MASLTEVKTYLAHWFQLGKVVKSDRGHTQYQIEKVIQGDHFSLEFENCWAAIMSNQGRDLYLEGTDQTIAELLSPAWEIISCARCDMPVPIPEVELQSRLCPCNDLPGWPNEEIPKPRLPVNNYQQLHKLKKRLQHNLSQESVS
ncbi:MAG: hypothetical protein HLUCCA11_07260 [Phormidesmis priestleyi Ana]|uniref:Uncharacterized protein n=1 Tax=Phormidesmis priestleyi Ana TaxID=1666911 RepID=A0A0P7ZS86_9CYAN|nr:MAG: hypothetical protein HLUCCA11_07260 [Phormidesmis priestleyi Ana]